MELKHEDIDFRDAIPTADRMGNRIWIYPRKPKGDFYTWRTWVSWLLLAILIAGPFIRVRGGPLLMMNFPKRQFAVFGQIFWPQDFYIFALLLLAAFIIIVLFTAVFGRVWCGWLCPQTIFMEMVFRKIEYWIDGDAYQQRLLADAPWTASKIRKRAFKHSLFFLLSFGVGNLLLAYIIGTKDLWHILRDNPLNHLGGLTAMIGFSLLFYGIFARFREQACTFICPYGRLQSVLLDNNSIVVAFDYRRGNPQQKYRKTQPHDERKTLGIGDCINCRMCVDVCPTGIDIRNGTQMECVNCTACIDACNSVMDRLSFPRGLIRYASLQNIEEGKPFTLTPRIIGYSGILLLLGGALGVILFLRPNVETQILRAPGAMFQELPDNRISNLYLVKVMNKTHRDIPVELRIESPPGVHLQIAGDSIRAPAERLAQSAVIAKAPRELIRNGNLKLEVGVYEEGKRVQKLKTNFVGPATP